MGKSAGKSFSNLFIDGTFWNLVIDGWGLWANGQKGTDTSTERDDIHIGALRKLGDETAKTLLHVSKFTVR